MNHLQSSTGDRAHIYARLFDTIMNKKWTGKHFWKAGVFFFFFHGTDIWISHAYDQLWRMFLSSYTQKRDTKAYRFKSDEYLPFSFSWCNLCIEITLKSTYHHLQGLWISNPWVVCGHLSDGLLQSPYQQHHWAQHGSDAKHQTTVEPGKHRWDANSTSAILLYFFHIYKCEKTKDY